MHNKYCRSSVAHPYGIWMVLFSIHKVKVTFILSLIHHDHTMLPPRSSI